MTNVRNLITLYLEKLKRGGPRLGQWGTSVGGFLRVPLTSWQPNNCDPLRAIPETWWGPAGHLTLGMGFPSRWSSLSSGEVAPTSPFAIRSLQLLLLCSSCGAPEIIHSGPSKGVSWARGGIARTVHLDAKLEVSRLGGFL